MRIRLPRVPFVLQTSFGKWELRLMTRTITPTQGGFAKDWHCIAAYPLDGQKIAATLLSIDSLDKGDVIDSDLLGFGTRPHDPSDPNDRVHGFVGVLQRTDEVIVS